MRVKAEKEADDFNLLATSSALAVISVFDAVAVAPVGFTGYTRERSAVIHRAAPWGSRYIAGRGSLDNGERDRLESDPSRVQEVEMSRYRKLVDEVIAENRKVLEAVSEAEIDRLILEIERAKKIQLFAMGRMQASMRGFAMRLKHMGFDAWVVFDTTTPAIGRETSSSSTARSPWWT